MSHRNSFTFWYPHHSSIITCHRVNSNRGRASCLRQLAFSFEPRIAEPVLIFAVILARNIALHNPALCSHMLCLGMGRVVPAKLPPSLTTASAVLEWLTTPTSAVSLPAYSVLFCSYTQSFVCTYTCVCRCMLGS